MWTGRGAHIARKYDIISGDSRLDLRPNRRSHHVPARYREYGPKVVHLEKGDAIQMGDRRPAPIGFTRSVNVPRQDLHTEVPRYDNACVTGSHQPRLNMQDLAEFDTEAICVLYGCLWHARSS